jgi:hypothetical protein
MGRDTHEQRLAPTVLALALACGPSPDAPDDARSADASAAIDAVTAPVDAAIADALAPDADPTIVDPALPLIHDHSGAPRAHVLDLVRRALDGLGFDPASGEVTSPTDGGGGAAQAVLTLEVDDNSRPTTWWSPSINDATCRT